MVLFAPVPGHCLLVTFNYFQLCRASINLLTQIAYSVNKNIKMSSFKSSESIQKKEGGPDRSVSDKQSSSVTLNDLAMKARKKL